MSKQWIVRQADHERQVAIAQALSISPITAAVLLARGLVSTENARQWLTPPHVPSHDPFLLPDMEKVVDRLNRAVRQKEPVAFYGDYDVDGVTATSLFSIFFSSLGADTQVYIPHRLREGYGLNTPALHALRKNGVGLVVTSDCGTTSHQEICAANECGLDVIVTDHHQLDAQMPPAFAVLNPYLADSTYPFKDLCSVGLAFKVVQAYRLKFGDEGYPLENLVDLVALGTVADVVPLQDENRLFVQLGLERITGHARPGIRALKRTARIENACTTRTVAFRLAPRINAAGRLAHALSGVRLLTTESDSEAMMIAEELERVNSERQRIEEKIKIDAMKAVEAGPIPSGIVVGDRSWHLGVVGIVAARLVERFARPAVVLAVDENGIGKGSARSVPGFDVYGAISACRDLLVGFGGHPNAAGLTILEAHIPKFRERFADVVSKGLSHRGERSALHVDAEVNLSEITRQVVQELDLLQPFGAGNPEPTLAVRDLSVLNNRVVGDRHLKMTVRHKNSVPFDSIGFRMGSLADQGLSPDRPVDLAFVPELNRWNGLDRVQLRIKDLRASQS